MQLKTTAEGCGKQFRMLHAHLLQDLPKPLRVSDPRPICGFTFTGQTDTLAPPIGWFSRSHNRGCVQPQYEAKLRIIHSHRVVISPPRNPLELGKFTVGTLTLHWQRKGTEIRDGEKSLLSFHLYEK
jgi:hypothetical protein